MNPAEVQQVVAFHLTGRCVGSAVSPVERGMVPALMARRMPLASLRYDYPVVLCGGKAEEAVQSLSSAFENAASQVVGFERGRLEKQTLKLEVGVRLALAKLPGKSLGEVVEGCLALKTNAHLREVADALKPFLPLDGVLRECGPEAVLEIARHLHEAAQSAKARRFLSTLDRLEYRLSEILRSGDQGTSAAREPEKLRAAVGTGFAGAFDFKALSKVLEKGSHGRELPPERRARLEWIVATLRSQRFTACPKRAKDATNGASPYGFVYRSTHDALAAFRERLPRLIELAKAMAIAELEIEGEYREDWHGPVFENYGSHGLDRAVLSQFPDYLVLVNSKALEAESSTAILEALSAGLPMKIVVVTDDLLSETEEAPLHLGFGLKNRQLASAAMSLADVFVLQAGASEWVRLRDRIASGFASDAPALFSAFSGSSGTCGEVPPYLVAAAATESRVFPTFVYDPSRGGDWAARFSVEDNPQHEAEWPMHRLEYETKDLRACAESVSFTTADFIAMDSRFSGQVAKVDAALWPEALEGVPAALESSGAGLPARAPFVFLADGEGNLIKAAITAPLLAESKRCLAMWHSLQELGGVHNSHAERLLAIERLQWEEERKRLAELPPVGAETSAPELPGGPAAALDAETALAAPVVSAEPEAKPPSDDPYIETARCSTCNECTNLNNRMFAYNENKQAYIKDPTAGTFRQLVEAAESCQVGIIHPGKPKNPNEPGLEELLKRAEAFA
ncbi:MAG: hypothetical protein HZC36_04070 [Armatimonadetes bacterium]|nr:hypothetical protein [Armatimonadota bacterium]